jgi:DNA-binding NtrC family response regulator
LFLDEIGDLPLNAQAKVLRAIEEKEILPIGCRKAIKVNTRIIAATNKDLQALTSARLFREDLLQRLCGFIINTPSLAGHPEEITLLARKFWEEISKEISGDPSELPREILRELESRPWPGNNRELKQTLRHLATLFGTESLNAEHLRVVFQIRSQVTGPAATPEHGVAAGNYRAECLRTLNRALELTQACESALATVPGSRNLSPTAWPALRRTLDRIRDELRELCSHPIWFHSLSTHRAVEALVNSLAGVCGPSGELARKSLAAKQAGLRTSMQAARKAIFREAEWLGAVPGEPWDPRAKAARQSQ